MRRKKYTVLFITMALFLAAATQVLDATRELSKQSELLKGQVDAFLVEIRSM